MNVVATTEGLGAGTIEGPLVELLARAMPEMTAYARRRIGATAADDVVSEVLVAALERARTGRSVTIGWLMAVASNKVVDHWRRHERDSNLVERLRAQQPMWADAPDAAADGVSILLETMRPRHRSILVRHYVRGEPVGVLAAEEGVSYRAMESAMARARRAFRAAYERNSLLQATDSAGWLR